MGFKKFFPLETESQSRRTMVDFIQLVGIPPAIYSYDAKVFQHGKFKSACRKYQAQQTFTEPYSPWQNRTGGANREVKSYGNKLLQIHDAPLRVWCFAYEYAAEVLSLCATEAYPLIGKTIYEHIMNYTPDILEYITFQWYQWSYYWDEIRIEKVLCRWLGVDHSIGQSVCYYVLKSNGNFITKFSVIPVPHSDLNSELL